MIPDKDFFIQYRPKGGDIVKTTVKASHAESALESIGWPNVTVFSLYVTAYVADVDAMLANNPAGKVLSFEEWESLYGPATSPKYLWVRPRPPHPAYGPCHDALNGRGSIEVCAHTGHVRRGSIGEYYDNWTAPKG